jgi:hypothetical protein
MKRSKDTESIAHALRRLSFSEQKHLIAGIRSMFGCRVQKYNAVIYEMAWGKMSTPQRAAVIRHVLKLYENFCVSS